MTTTANKAGLRATAEAKREKAAQKTPLPPKGGVQKVDVPDYAEQYCKMTAAQLKNVLRNDFDVKPKARVTLGQLLEMVLKAERERRAAQETVEEKPTPKGRSPRKATPAATITVQESPPAKPAKVPAKEPEVVEPRKTTKAARYAEEFTKLGWEPSISVTDALVELIARRTDEAIYLAWLREAHVSGTSTYTIADRTVKVRNPAEAMRIAARKPDEAKANQAKVSGNLQFRRKATGPVIKTIPFDPEKATNEEVIAALEARRISWHNQYRVISETATVGHAQKITVGIHPAGGRIVSFVDPEFGFRALRLENLENVGRRVDLERIKQQIINSLHKDASRKEKASR